MRSDFEDRHHGQIGFARISVKSWCDLQPGPWKISWVDRRALLRLPVRGDGLPSPQARGPRRPPPSRRAAEGVAGPEAWPWVPPFPTFGERPVVQGSRSARGGRPTSGARPQRTGQAQNGAAPACFRLRGQPPQAAGRRERTGAGQPRKISRGGFPET